MMRFEVGFNELASYNCESLACILQLCVMRFLIGVNALASYNCVSDVEYKEHRQAHPNSGSDDAAAAAAALTDDTNRSNRPDQNYHSCCDQSFGIILPRLTCHSPIASK